MSHGGAAARACTGGRAGRCRLPGPAECHPAVKPHALAATAAPLPPLRHAPDHLSFRMSRQMLPYVSTLGWKHAVSNRTCSRGGGCGGPGGQLLCRPGGWVPSSRATQAAAPVQAFSRAAQPRTVGGLKGYSLVNLSERRNVQPSYAVPSAPCSVGAGQRSAWTVRRWLEPHAGTVSSPAAVQKRGSRFGWAPPAPLPPAHSGGRGSH